MTYTIRATDFVARELSEAWQNNDDATGRGTVAYALTGFFGNEVVDKIVDFESLNVATGNGLAVENERLEAENAQLNEQLAAIKTALS